MSGLSQTTPYVPRFEANAAVAEGANLRGWECSKGALQKAHTKRLEIDVQRIREELHQLRVSMSVRNEKGLACEELEKELVEVKQEIQLMRAENSRAQMQNHQMAVQTFSPRNSRSAIAESCDQSMACANEMHLDETIDASLVARENSLVARDVVRHVFGESQRRVEMVDQILRVKKDMLRQKAFEATDKITTATLVAALVTWKASVNSSSKFRRGGDILKRTGFVVATMMMSTTLAATLVTWKAVAKGSCRLWRSRDALGSSWARLESLGCLRLCLVAWRNVTSHGWWAQMCGERADLLAQLQRAKNAVSEERQRWAEEHRAHKRTQDQLDQALAASVQGFGRAEKTSIARENRIQQLTGANGWLQLQVRQLEQDLGRSRAREAQTLLRLDKVLASQAAAIHARNPGNVSSDKPDDPQHSISKAESIESNDGHNIPVLRPRAPFHEEVSRTVPTSGKTISNASSTHILNGGPRGPGLGSSLSNAQACSLQDVSDPGLSIESRDTNRLLRRIASTGDLTPNSGPCLPHWASGAPSSSVALVVDGESFTDEGKHIAGAWRPRNRPSSAGASRPL